MQVTAQHWYQLSHCYDSEIELAYDKKYLVVPDEIGRGKLKNNYCKLLVISGKMAQKRMDTLVSYDSEWCAYL